MRSQDRLRLVWKFPKLATASAATGGGSAGGGGMGGGSTGMGGGGGGVVGPAGGGGMGGHGGMGGGGRSMGGFGRGGLARMVRPHANLASIDVKPVQPIPVTAKAPATNAPAAGIANALGNVARIGGHPRF